MERILRDGSRLRNIIAGGRGFIVHAVLRSARGRVSARAGGSHADDRQSAALARAALESFAAENWARLETTHAAQNNIDRRLGELRRRERSLRQDEITTELMDVVAGASALQLR